jgi:5-formyltetrahydrofolate cyclo-ligase
LAFSVQEIDKVPIGMHDQKLDYIVTNKNIIK